MEEPDCSIGTWRQNKYVYIINDLRSELNGKFKVCIGRGSVDKLLEKQRKKISIKDNYSQLYIHFMIPEYCLAEGALERMRAKYGIKHKDGSMSRWVMGSLTNIIATLCTPLNEITYE